MILAVSPLLSLLRRRLAFGRFPIPSVGLYNFIVSSNGFNPKELPADPPLVSVLFLPLVFCVPSSLACDLELYLLRGLARVSPSLLALLSLAGSAPLPLHWTRQRRLSTRSEATGLTNGIICALVSLTVATGDPSC